MYITRTAQPQCQPGFGAPDGKPFDIRGPNVKGQNPKPPWRLTPYASSRGSISQIDVPNVDGPKRIDVPKVRAPFGSGGSRMRPGMFIVSDAFAKE